MPRMFENFVWPFRKCLIWVAGALVVMSTSSWCQAQTRILWWQDKKIEISKTQILIKGIDNASPILETIQLPPACLWASWRPDGIYCLVEAEGRKGAERRVVRREYDGSWAAFATIPKGLESVYAALLADDGVLFLIPRSGLFKFGGQLAAPFVKLSQDAKGDWTIAKPVGLEWGVLQREILPNGREHLTNFGRYLFTFSAAIEAPDLADRLFELPQGWAFLDRHHGFVWVFGEDGVLKSRISLFDDLKDEELDHEPIASFPTGVLACESAPGGHLLIAGRSDAAYYFSRKVRPLLVDGKVTPLSTGQDNISDREFPEIQWWDVDTEVGQAHRIPTPEGLPSKIPTDASRRNWTFHFSVDSNGVPHPEKLSAEETK